MWKNKYHSLYVQLAVLLAAAAAFAAVMFFGMNYLSKKSINEWMKNTDYQTEQNENYINKLQKYIEDNNLTVKDTAEVDRWVRKQGLIVVALYHENVLIYDSEYSQEYELSEEEIAPDNYEWNQYYDIKMGTETVLVRIYGNYAYGFYHVGRIICMMAALLIFVAVVLLALSRKIRYVQKLKNELEILRRGDLDYEITISGNDELTKLAAGIDSMRISFREQRSKENEMVRENQQIITEMSHDIRTPITSVLLYTEILKKGAYKNETQLQNYLEKIWQKSRRMKQLTNNLFEYALLSGSSETNLDEPEYVKNIFYDLFSETAGYLEQNGFRAEFHIEWPERKIQVSTEYITRIMDNLVSNVIKYADPSEVIHVFGFTDGEYYIFRTGNKIRKLEEKTDSTGIGMQSIRNMMRKMHGKCDFEENEDEFSIRLAFLMLPK